MPKVRVNGIEMHYEEQGTGDEIFVFVHGATSSGRNNWRTIWPLLPANYHCYAPDMRGHGKLAEVTEAITCPQMTEDVYRFSRELGLGRFVALGCSMGGRVVLDLAIAHSEALKGVVMLQPAPARHVLQPDWVQPSYADYHKAEGIRAMFESVVVRAPLPEELMQGAIEAAMLIKEATYLQMNDFPKMYPDVEARLGEIKVPALMLISGKDAILPPDDQWRTVKQIPGAKAVFFEDEGHLMVGENPEKLVSEMTRFIAELR